MFRCAVRRTTITRLRAGVAQLVEQLIRNQQVLGSSPSAGSKITNKTKILDGANLPEVGLTANLTAYHLRRAFTVFKRASISSAASRCRTGAT